MYLHTKMNLLGKSFQNIEHYRETDRQTYREKETHTHTQRERDQMHYHEYIRGWRKRKCWSSIFIIGLKKCKRMFNSGHVVKMLHSWVSARTVISHTAVHQLEVIVDAVRVRQQWRRQLWGTRARAPPSTSNNCIFSSLWSKSKSQLSQYCVVCEIS